MNTNTDPKKISRVTNERERTMLEHRFLIKKGQKTGKITYWESVSNFKLSNRQFPNTPFNFVTITYLHNNNKVFSISDNTSMM